MVYKNGEVILPPDLLNELQKYVQGELIYIPKKSKKRAGWGEMNGTKAIIQNRNFEIYNLYSNGLKTQDLAQRYHLSEASIRKIIVRLNKYD